ncbi:MAG: circadian clock KaiB domain protein [Verrucomicrobia bacterium]|nr:circadian clock KaiB domain protein [Verrucomicrobiota bacterium]
MSAKTKSRARARKASPRRSSPRRSPAAADGNRTSEFEALLHETSKKQRYELRLYVTGTSSRSGQAIANVRALCEEFLAGRYDLKVIDIYQQPLQASNEQIIAAPTLIRITPKPLRRLIGNLSDRDKVLVGLNLAVRSASTAWMAL